MKVAVVGVTGLVGTVMCEVLTERNFPITEFLPVASARSVGKKLTFKGKEHTIIGLETALAAKPDIAIFSAGGSVSKEWAPKFAEVGTTVVDNSSAWRMDPTKKLVVPEVNANEFITGTGVKAVKQYEAEKHDTPLAKEEMAYAHPIFDNCIPHCDIFLDNDYTKEEMKLVHETKKIFGDDSLRITATAVRVPVHGGHSETVNIEFAKPYEVADVKQLLMDEEGVIVLDDITKDSYPMPRFAKNEDEVFVGRIRRDESADNALNIWVVADNLRKGAATNAVQIAEYLVAKNLVGGEKMAI